MAVDAVPSMIDAFVTRADLADLALFIWASGASTAAAMMRREPAASNRRFDAFVRELHGLAARHADD